MAARAMGHRLPRIHYKSTDTGRNALQEEFRYFRIMLARRKSFAQVSQLAPGQWLAVFVALFWLVPAVELLVRAVLLVFPVITDTSSDFYRACLHWDISQIAMHTILGIVGMGIVTATFRLVPAAQRFTLAMAMIPGCVIGVFLEQCGAISAAISFIGKG